MNRELMVHVSPFELHVAILEDDELVEYYVERKKDRSIVGNIYKGKVGKVLPGMQSAFVDLGLEKNAFLYVTDFLEEFSDLKEVMEDEEEGKRRKSPSHPPAAPAPAQPGEEGEGAIPLEGTEAISKESAALPGPTGEPFLGNASLEKLAEHASPVSEVPAPAVKKRSRRRRRSSAAGSGSAKPAAGSLPKTGRKAPATEKLEQFFLESETEIAASDAESADRTDDNSVVIRLPEEDVPYSAERRPRRRSSGRKRRHKGFSLATESEPGNIATMLREGEEIIVQAVKEPIAQKSSRITSHISLPGRMLVFLPTFNRIGVSKKIQSDQERKRLRSIVADRRGERQGGFIIRTASEGCTEDELVRDMDYLIRTWENVLEQSANSKAPTLLYQEPGVTERLLRDKLDETYQCIWVDDEETFTQILAFVERLMPQMLPRVKLFSRPEHIFEYFNLVPEIQKALQAKVWLPSGGFIVINHTEALVAIDVNTGKYVGRNTSFEETITKINLDAAREIIRQIRLRNLGGIIVMDFIDMLERKNKKLVMEVLQQELKRDKSPSKVLSINEFGLAIMTRKRTAGALERSLSQSCPCCNGSGMVKSLSTVCFEIFDTVDRMRSELSGKHVVIRASTPVVKALKIDEKEVVEEIRHRFGLDVVLIPDPKLPLQTFDITDQ